MTRQRAFDVAVVGAGPAGSTAALELAARGVRVALLEKEVLPRYKTCGGALVGRVFDNLPQDISSCIHRSFHNVDLVFHDAGLVSHEAGLQFCARRDQPVVSMVMRDEFDACLSSSAVEAGAVLLESCRVTGIASSNGRVRLDTTDGTVSAGFVVAADGATGAASRAAGWPIPRTAIPALEWEVEVDTDTFTEMSNSVRFDFGVVPHGYAWVFPKREHLSVGVLSTRRGASHLQRQLQQYLQRLRIEAITRIKKHGFVIPIRPLPGQLVQNRTVLVGDAAGFADPVTAEGISFAVLSGRLAAQAVVDGDLDQAAVQRCYHALVRKCILRELACARMLSKLLYEFPEVRSRVFKRCGRELASAMTDIIVGESTYRQAIGNPINYARLLSRQLRS